MKRAWKYLEDRPVWVLITGALLLAYLPYTVLLLVTTFR